MGSLLLVLIYVCFISLGLPDSLLGSAWPVLHAEMDVPVSCAGYISTVIFVGTILSSLYSTKLLYKFGAAKVTAVSVALTATGLFGFSVSSEFWMLLLWAVPYGFGAGGVDAILNNYVALYYKAQHMSWLHCMWGVGASISPYIMSFSLVRLERWNYGYLIVAVIQTVLTAVIFISLPLWKRGVEESSGESKKTEVKAISYREIFKIPGAFACFLTFFCYCSLELTTSLWASSYLVQQWSFAPEDAAGFASMFYIGITLGRLANGFLAMKLSDKFLIRMGVVLIACGVILLCIPLNAFFAWAAFAVIGLGCAPIYPCIIHMTPGIFGRDKSQAMIGMQMAFAYTGFLIMPTVFGVIADWTSIGLLPVYIFVLLAVMFIMHEVVVKKAGSGK